MFQYLTVHIVWERNNYIASGLSNVTACVTVHNTLATRDINISIDIQAENGKDTYSFQFV